MGRLDPSTGQDVPAFERVGACWICGGRELRPVHTAVFELSEYRRQDPQLAAYSGTSVRVVRCGACGFGQPEELPMLPGYFGRMYDQRWSEEWMEREFRSGYKDLIFRTVLHALDRLLPPGRRLLDLGAHVGRLMYLAHERGWEPEGIELNPSTAAFAERMTRLRVHRHDARDLAESRRYGAVTLIDVLEHIPQPVQALEEARGVLAPGGWIAVKVPHGRNQLRKEEIRARISPGYRATVADNLVHVNHFGPKSLRLALERAGFVDVRVTVAAPELIPDGGLAARRVASNAVRIAAYHAARVLPGDSPLALHLQAYARNPE